MSSPAWRQATPEDLDVMMAIQDEVHSMLPERREVFADKMRLFGEGCLLLVRPGIVLGYGIAHPWLTGTVPPLDTMFGALPSAADCLFVHDVALRSEARGRGAGGAFVKRMRALAQERGLASMALVSVYGTVPVWERCGFRLAAGAVPADKLAIYGDTARFMVAEVDPGSDVPP